MSSLVLKLVERPDGSLARGMIGPDGMQVFSVYDFMTTACGYVDTGATARKEFGRLTKDGSDHKEEIEASCRSLHFPGQRGPGTPCMTIRGLQRLLMILGGKVAAEFRKIIEGTFTRVMAGDQSLIEVINANAASQEPVQQAYRDALAQEPVAPLLDDFCLGKKRRREELLSDLEIAKLEVGLVEIQRQIEDDKLAIEERKLNHRCNLLQYTNTALGSINTLNELANVDEHTKIQAQDHIKNLLFNPLATKATQTDDDEIKADDIKLAAETKDKEHANAIKAINNAHVEVLKIKEQEHANTIKANNTAHMEAIKIKDQEHANTIKANDNAHTVALKIKVQEHANTVKANDNTHMEALKIKDQEHYNALRSMEEVTFIYFPQSGAHIADILFNFQRHTLELQTMVRNKDATILHLQVGLIFRFRASDADCLTAENETQ